MLSRSSIAPSERLLLLGKKSESIEEIPEEQVKVPSKDPSLTLSDSFEYANSEDKLRIRRMEQMWRKSDGDGGRQWRSPQLERKQQKIKEYQERRKLNKVVKPESRESDSEGSDDSERGWSFIGTDDKKLQRNTTVRRATNLNPLSTSSSARRSPSILALQQKLDANPRLQAPFTIQPGIYTDQRSIARKFGNVVDTFRKPGHHVGPAKNPDCPCDHCRNYFEKLGSRGRAQSATDVYGDFRYKRDSTHSIQSTKEKNIV